MSGQLRFYPGAESWPLYEVQREFERASAALAFRLTRGSTADSEKLAVLELAVIMGCRLFEFDQLLEKLEGEGDPDLRAGWLTEAGWAAVQR